MLLSSKRLINLRNIVVGDRKHRHQFGHLLTGGDVKRGSQASIPRKVGR